MKNYFVIIVVLSFFVYSQTFGQSINLESSVKADTAKAQLSVQRIEISGQDVSFKYDYKADGRDVLGLIIPKIVSDSTASWGGLVLKTGDGDSKDQFVFDTWGRKKFGKLSVSIELGRIVSQTNRPWDCIGSRLSYGNFTVEFYELTYHPMLGEKVTKQDANYSWIAYHPTHAFIALGKQDRQYWGFVGTKNLERFGNFTFVNYQPETGNFWFRSQTGFGDINQKFFCQDLYVDGVSYMVVPAFYFKHFSPICTKGDYSLKFEGRRVGDIQNYEMMMGKKVGNEIVRLAAGLNSEYQSNLHIAPVFELYKSFKLGDSQQIIELRYDVLYRTFSGYLVIRY